MASHLSELLDEVRKNMPSSFEASRNALGPPRLDLAREFVRQASARVDALNRAAGVCEEVALLVRKSVLHATLPALIHYRHGHGTRARALLDWIWAIHAAAFGVVQPQELASVLPEPAIEPVQPAPEDQEYGEILNQAIREQARERSAGDEARRALRELMTVLAINTEYLGRMFEVSGETARRWEQGIVAVPQQQQAGITQAGDALTRLRTFFRAERLPAVIRRRPAPLFAGESALDWILRGRIREVADRYDRLFAYEPDVLQQLAATGS